MVAGYVRCDQCGRLVDGLVGLVMHVTFADLRSRCRL